MGSGRKRTARLPGGPRRCRDLFVQRQRHCPRVRTGPMAEHRPKYYSGKDGFNLRCLLFRQFPGGNETAAGKGANRRDKLSGGRSGLVPERRCAFFRLPVLGVGDCNANMYESFLVAQKMMAHGQTAVMDADGDGVQTKEDVIMARDFRNRTRWNCRFHAARNRGGVR